MKNKIWRIIEHSVIAQYLVVMTGTAIALLLLYWFISHVDILWYDLFRCPAPFSALEFDEVGDIADGRVRVADNGQEWILDTKSRELVPAPHDYTYDYLGKLSNGLRRARKTNQESFGYIDDKGQAVIPFIYDYADDLHRDVARVRIKRQYTLIDRSGQEIIPRYRDVHIYGEQGFIGAEKADGGEDFFDLYGKPLTASALQAVYMARDREKRNGLRGFILPTSTPPPARRFAPICHAWFFPASPRPRGRWRCRRQGFARRGRVRRD